jgi:hypothetical protein
MSSVTAYRAGLAVLIAAALLGGIALGTALPSLTNAPEASPSSTESALPSATGLPAADVPGEDLARLPRYPGSVRTEFSVSLDERYRLTAVEYLADASLDAVRAFYQGVIAEHGWERADIGYSAGEWTYVLVDGGTEALIEIEITGGVVEIDLHISEPVPAAPAERTPTPATPAPPPAQPAPPPPGDDDDDDGADDGDDSDDGGGSDD